jgi:hypothetical protein
MESFLEMLPTQQVQEATCKITQHLGTLTINVIHTCFLVNDEKVNGNDTKAEEDGDDDDEDDGEVEGEGGCM